LQFSKSVRVSNLRLSLSNQVSGFSKGSGSPKLAFLALVIFQVFRFSKLAFAFSQQVSVSAWSGSQN
jgi:hypothetical protein